MIHLWDSGAVVTRKKISTCLYCKGFNKAVRNYIRACNMCQRYKPDLSSPIGLLQPLPIPGAIWVDISLGFIKGLPKSRGKYITLVVVDRLSKYPHFLSLAPAFIVA